MQGQRLHSASTPGFSITTSFLEYLYEPVPGLDGARPLIFRVAVRNSGAQRALLDPSAFRLLPPDSGPPLPAIDPEHVLLAAERGKIAENASHAGRAGAEAMLDLPMIILDAAADLSGGKPPQAERDRRRLEEERGIEKAESEARHEKALKEWDGVRSEWSVNALRKTTLMPGMEAQGRVAFAVTGNGPPPDTLLLQWKRPDGNFADLGRYGRPPLPVDTLPKPRDPRDPRQAPFP